jgi:hypothetical protein
MAWHYETGSKVMTAPAEFFTSPFIPKKQPEGLRRESQLFTFFLHQSAVTAS